MKEAAQALEFEKAAQLRDRVLALKDLELGLPAKAAGVKGLLGSGALSRARRRSGSSAARADRSSGGAGADPAQRRPSGERRRARPPPAASAGPQRDRARRARATVPPRATDAERRGSAADGRRRWCCGRLGASGRRRRADARALWRTVLGQPFEPARRRAPLTEEAASFHTDLGEVQASAAAPPRGFGTFEHGRHRPADGGVRRKANATR